MWDCGGLGVHVFAKFENKIRLWLTVHVINKFLFNTWSSFKSAELDTLFYIDFHNDLKSKLMFSIFTQKRKEFNWAHETEKRTKTSFYTEGIPWYIIWAKLFLYYILSLFYFIIIVMSPITETPLDSWFLLFFLDFHCSFGFAGNVSDTEFQLRWKHAAAVHSIGLVCQGITS